MLASEFVARSLRLINVPGRGSDLQPGDQLDAISALQEILDSEAVSKRFVPGIRRHFFPMVQGKAIYSYGASPQFDLRSDDFEDDPPPIKIEDAYIREGSTITDNQEVDEPRFENVGTWVESGTAAIANNQATIVGIGDVLQALTLTIGDTFTIRLTVDVNIGDVDLIIQENAVNVINTTLDASGFYTFDFVITDILPTVQLITDNALDDVSISDLSIIERGKDALELPDSQGSDYGITVVDQTHYNRRFTKGTGGRPYEILYSRGFDREQTRSEIRFDNSAVAGDILVMDVLVNRVQINGPSSVMRVQPDAIKWLRYATADSLAGEYGKSLSARQVMIMDEAWNKLAIGNRRMNMLGVDRSLRERPTFDINRGDP